MVNKRYTENKNNYSIESLKWIKYIEKIKNIKIISAFDGLEEEIKIITKIDNKKQNLKVDGYDEKNKIVYQFQGCYYHGCPKCYKPDDINTENNTLMKDLYNKTLETNENIINSGYKLKQMWECDWDTMIKLAYK